ncbi:hypothetical protein BC939DRAFT_502146 [Gamsiella multidivaricata]|uniref:uncharacterized protein n=1 Tax=Gamsiella multidivaricata TaxID=101098 RepID=UPI0022210D2D|nr:uncharacterized protein BC939DRAFT_502146 [Gamsiella multidivaricata]KAG0364048.1 hypothetical protein BGZ54_007892 [Gamsiella multidivaricata]KAI7825702.1 hypothetical protein BC939DRAFT_502146 [Gamsiella multidivaricata]
MIFTRTGIRARASLGATPLRSGTHHYTNTGGKNIPLSTKNKTALALKMTIYCGGGFAVGFVPGQWQSYKANRI